MALPAPFLLVNFLVILGPSLATFYYSLTDWNGIGTANYIGLQNFRDLSGDHNFRKRYRHVVIWTASS